MFKLYSLDILAKEYTLDEVVTVLRINVQLLSFYLI